MTRVHLLKNVHTVETMFKLKILDGNYSVEQIVAGLENASLKTGGGNSGFILDQNGKQVARYKMDDDDETEFSWEGTENYYR